jgi:hypothetical protein
MDCRAWNLFACVSITESVFNMTATPRWFLAVAVIALLWNAFGLLAVVSDLSLSKDAIAKLPSEQQALYAARPLWSVAASLLAVIGGTFGCLGLLLRRRWATPVLLASLIGVIIQDAGLFIIARKAVTAVPVAFVLQGLVLVVAIGLVVLGRMASARSWLR